MPAKTREEWLERVVRALRPLYLAAGLQIPPGTRVSCSWPTSGAIGRKRRTDGETMLFKDGTPPEIFISPAHGDELRVAGIVAHELVHAALPASVDHRHRAFRDAMAAVGLVGRPIEAEPGPELQRKLRRIVRRLGTYPHAGIRA